MKWFLCLLISVEFSARALEASAKVELPKGQNYSCQLMRHRVHHQVKGRKGLQALLQQMTAPGGWNAAQADRLEAYLGRAGFLPPVHLQRQVKLSVDWIIPETWAAALNGEGRMSVAWSFLGTTWTEETGILPDEVQSFWHADVSTLSVSTLVTPFQLCFGPREIQLRLGNGNEFLELNSEVIWL